MKKTLIKKGAEADIYLTNWNDEKAIYKKREPKEYRNLILDIKLRKHRTIREASIMHDVKLFGIHAPLVYFVDTKKTSILMQYIEGNLVKDLPDRKLVKICKEIGRIVGRMHKSGIMHGDLTTSNFIMQKDRVFLIDFGLSSRTRKIEDHAIDLRLFKEILNSAHTAIMEQGWTNFLQGYKSIVGVARKNQVFSYVSIIEQRGRYATVV